jgi:hypothetical protein
MCAVPNIPVFCSSLISCFPGIIINIIATTPDGIPVLTWWCGLRGQMIPESYAGGSVAPGWVSDAGQVKKEYPGPPGCRLGVRQTTSPRKKNYVEKPSRTPRMGLINWRRCGCKKKNLIFSTRNVRNTVQNWSIYTSALPIRTVHARLMENSPRSIGKPRIWWQDVVQKVALEVLGIRRQRRRHGDREEGARAQKGL